MFNQLSINKRLALALWGSALVAFVVAGAGLLLYQNLTLAARAQQIMEPYAQLVSVGSDAAVAFEDPVRAQEILESLRANPQILSARIILEDGRPLAGFGDHVDHGTPPPAKGTDGVFIDQGEAELIQGLPRGGSLHLVMSLSKLQAQAQQALWMFFAGVLVLAAVTLAQLIVLRRTIIRPVAALADAAEAVRARGDYTLRVPAVGNDEIAQLGRNFNGMMDAVRERDRNLLQLALFQRTILNNAAYGIISTTPDGKVTSFNPAAEQLLGYTASEVLEGRSPELWHDPLEVAERARQLSAELGETIAPGFNVFVARARRDLPEESEWTFRRKNGTRVPVLLSVTALRDDEGRLTGFVGMVSDLTERKRADEELDRHRHHLEELVATRTWELAEARDAAEAANQAKSVFLSNMSHELRTPLNAILGFAQIMEWDERIPADERDNLRAINRSGRHLLALINDVLEISRIEAGRMTTQPTDFDLPDLLAAVVESQEVRARDKGLALRMTLPPELPCFVRTDAGKLRQILLNLVSNALKYTERGEVEISAEATRSGAPQTQLVFSVRDTGVGISAADLERIFQPFFQAEYGAALGEGTGLGLTISKDYAKLLGGDLSVESEPHRGSTFRLAIPVEPAQELPLQHDARGSVVGLAAEQPPCRLLVVDDNADSRRLLEEVFKRADFLVHTANNGEEAVHGFLSWHPDLIWMDMRMPVMDGYEATRRIRSLPGGKTVKIVALTASAFEEDRGRIFAAGCDDVLSKPFEKEQLFAAMGRLLGLRYLHADEPRGVSAAPTVLDGLSALPAALREDLHQAARLLDVEAAEQAISRILEINAPLAGELDELVRTYRFDRLSSLCENS